MRAVDNRYLAPNSLSPGFARIIKGFGSNVIGQIITAISSILTVPLFIDAWGTDIYGKWLTLFALVSYLTLLDLGGQNYIGNLLSQAFAQNDDDLFRDVLSRGISLFLFIFSIGWLLFLSVLFLPPILFPVISYPFDLSDKLILLALGTNNLISVPAGVFVTCYRATGRLARGTMIGNLARIVSLGIQVLILILHFSPLIFSTVSLAVGITLTAYLLFDSKLSIPQRRSIKINFVNLKAGFPYLGAAAFFWFLSLSTLINSQGVIIILGSKTSSTEVALYSTHRTVAGLLGYIGGLLLSPLWPELTFLYSQSRKEELTRASLVTIKFIVTITGLTGLALFLLLPIVYPTWIGKRMDLNILLLTIFLVQGILYSGWATSSWPLLASNQHKKIALWSLMNSMVTVVLALIFVENWGLLGVAIATLIGDILCGFLVFPHLAGKSLVIQTKNIYVAILKPLLLVVLCSIAILTISLIIPEKQVPLSLFLLVLISIPAVYYSVGKDDLTWLIKNSGVNIYFNR